MCKRTVSYFAICDVTMYYANCKDPRMTHVVVHYGTNNHPIVDGVSKGANSKIHNVVKAHVV